MNDRTLVALQICVLVAGAALLIIAASANQPALLIGTTVAIWISRAIHMTRIRQRRHMGR